MLNFAQAYSWINLRFLMMGLGITLYVSLVSIILSFILGGLLGFVRYLRLRYVSVVVGIIIDVIRNLPLLLLLFFMYFGLPHLIGWRLGTISATILAMTLFESAMLAEIIRSGIESVDSGQMEAARSNGLTFMQAMWSVILPQALKKMVPPIVSQFVSLVKDTSLATIIMLPELMYRAQIIYGQNTQYMIPIFLLLAAIYFVVCFALSQLSHKLARLLN